ncbi:MAG: L-ribulose-5-phosphate 4-epimerase [Planctomycetota bacterium]|nr:L-ribulose-5-phosphate 4-epimerase [Planctomycetota bacterium]
MLEELKERVCRANLRLVADGLVVMTWGNVSAIDRQAGLVVIKPSGLAYAGMRAEDMVVVSLADGEVVEGSLRPSSDTPTHLELYRAWKDVGGIVHTHSLFATAWSQACREIPALGTTHADTFHGPVPCTRKLTPAEIAGDYEANTGKVILERFAQVNPWHFPAVLVAEHGPFAWGKDAQAAGDNALVLEQVARLAAESLRLRPDLGPIQSEILDKHFLRKHGPGAYYGQEEK